jgi:hypothetical protein
MADLNPQAVVRDINSSPSLGRQVHDFIVRVAGGGTRSVVIETKLKSILQCIPFNETDHVFLTPTYGDSTTYVGTKTVTVTVANAKVYSIRITGIYGTRAAVTDISPGDADVTVTYHPLRSQ